MPFNNRRRLKFAFIPFVAIGFLLLLGWVVMRLWNEILPPLLHTGTLSYFRAIGLLVLCRILFGNFRQGPGRRFKDRSAWREKWSKMTTEEKQQFRQQWKDRCEPYNKKSEQ